jgi:hypothetical protein
MGFVLPSVFWGHPASPAWSCDEPTLSSEEQLTSKPGPAALAVRMETLVGLEIVLKRDQAFSKQLNQILSLRTREPKEGKSASELCFPGCVWGSEKPAGEKRSETESVPLS